MNRTKSGRSFKEVLVSLRALVMMQLKDKIDMNFFKNKKRAFLRVSLSVLGFVALTAIIYVLLYLASLMRIFSFGSLIPTNVLSFIFTIMMLLSIITCSFGLMKSLYFSKDNPVLLTLPVTKTEIFLSKLVVYYLNELKKTTIFILPLFLAYGLVNGLPVAYFFWLLLCVFVVALIPVAVGSILSIFLMAINLLLKRNKIVEAVCVLGAIALVTWAVVAVINIIPENINIVGSWGTIYWQIQDFLSWFAVAFKPFTLLTRMIVGTIDNLAVHFMSGTTFAIFFSCLAMIVGLFILAFLIAKPLFFKMASTTFEFKKSTKVRKVKNHKTNPFFSGVKKEFLEFLRNPSKSITLLSTAIALPVVTLLLNTIFSAMSVRLVGTYMTIAFNLLIISLIATASSTPIAHTFSEEGNASYTHKTSPQNYHISLLPKLVINWVLMTISILVAVGVFKVFSGVSMANTILVAVSLIAVYTAHLLWSAELDIMNPQNDQFQTTGIGKETNENKSILIAFISSFLLAGLFYFFINDASLTVYWKVCLIAVLFLVFRVVVYFKKVNVFYLKPYKEGK